MPASKPAFPVLQRGHPLANGLVFAAPMYEGSGLTVNDLSGNGNNGTINGTITWAGGQSGWAASLDGATGFVNVPDSASLSPANFTAQIWLNPTSLPASGGIYGVMDKRDNGGGTAGWILELFNNSGTQQVVWGVGATTFLFLNATLATNAWSHLVVSQLGTTATIYVNGASIGSGPALAVTNFATPLKIGKRSDGHFFPGKIDATAIWNRALSANEVESLYADSFQMFRRRRAVLKAATTTSGLLLARRRRLAV